MRNLEAHSTHWHVFWGATWVFFWCQVLRIQRRASVASTWLGRAQSRSIVWSILSYRFLCGQHNCMSRPDAGLTSSSHVTSCSARVGSKVRMQLRSQSGQVEAEICVAISKEASHSGPPILGDSRIMARIAPKVWPERLSALLASP